MRSFRLWFWIIVGIVDIIAWLLLDMNLGSLYSSSVSPFPHYHLIMGGLFAFLIICPLIYLPVLKKLPKESTSRKIFANLSILGIEIILFFSAMELISSYMGSTLMYMLVPFLNALIDSSIMPGVERHIRNM